jgi:surfeit locus 1 family protein
MRAVVFALVIGLLGSVVLAGLGFWQVQRLQWKEAIIAQAEAQIAAPPVPLPARPDPATDRYRAVKVSGRFTGEETHVLTSEQGSGPGFLVIGAFLTGDGRRILIDRGFVPETEKATPRPGGGVTEILGNLNWPDDVTPSTPGYNADRGIWFGRDVTGMSALLGTEPLLVIARSDTGDAIRVRPVTTSGFRNDHLEYAVTWFSLALVWLGMTAGFLWRIRRRVREGGPTG